MTTIEEWLYHFKLFIFDIRKFKFDFETNLED